MTDTRNSSVAYDPQKLSLGGSINALIALGRIPLASEVPLWTIFGCILSARLFPSTGAVKGITSIDWWVVFQCAFTTWATNISINYGNEFFDWNLDRPGQVESIKKAVRAREELMNKEKKGQAVREQQEQEEKVHEFNEKIMGNTTRIIHDGTFPPYTALVLGAAWQAAVIGLIFYSRSKDASLHTIKPTSAHGSPYRGLPLQIGIISSILSQMYVGPPVRLHYHGFGELISALLLNPVAILFGMTGYYTATTGRAVHLSDLFTTSTSGFNLGPVWVLLGAMYCFEQARIFIMHIQDIEADIAGGKITFVVRVGHAMAARLYVIFNILALGLFGLFTRIHHIPHHGLKANHLNTFSRGWKQGITAVLLYSIPIMIITARSLFAQIPPGRLSTASQQGGGLFAPRLLTVLPMLVSLQVLLSPIVLSIFTLLNW